MSIEDELPAVPYPFKGSPFNMYPYLAKLSSRVRAPRIALGGDDHVAVDVLCPLRQGAPDLCNGPGCPGAAPGCATPGCPVCPYRRATIDPRVTVFLRGAADEAKSCSGSILPSMPPTRLTKRPLGGQPPPCTISSTASKPGCLRPWCATLPSSQSRWSKPCGPVTHVGYPGIRSRSSMAIICPRLSIALRNCAAPGRLPYLARR